MINAETTLFTLHSSEAEAAAQRDAEDSSAGGVRESGPGTGRGALRGRKQGEMAVSWSTGSSAPA